MHDATVALLQASGLLNYLSRLHFQPGSVPCLSVHVGVFLLLGLFVSTLRIPEPLFLSMLKLVRSTIPNGAESLRSFALLLSDIFSTHIFGF